MNLKNVLVLGSKPDSNLPDINVDKIYTANGAAERAYNYRKKYPNTPLTCVVGAPEFVRNHNVSKRIIKSNPERLIVRGSMGLPKELENHCEITCLNQKEHWDFQKKFFRFGGLTIINAEFFYRTNYLQKMIHLLKHFKHNNFLGISTGFYSILLAIEENPDANIIISGIGMVGGSEFYKSERSKIFDYFPRARVDRFLIKRINKDLKKRMFSLDEDLVKNANITLWNGKTI